MGAVDAKDSKHFCWTYQQIGKFRHPEPYDRISDGWLRELDAPDGSTVFLVRQTHFDDQSGNSVHYAIEAPPSCVMRQAFEWGEITWEEFWTHKESLYRILLPFNPGYVTTERITPADIDPAALASFRALEGRFPYELKRQQLELGWEHAVLGGSKDAANAERQYREFMMRFGSRFANRAA